jgi:hypothetical protein
MSCFGGVPSCRVVRGISALSDALQWRIEHPDIEKDWRLAAFVKVNEGMRDEAEALASTGSPKPGWMEAEPPSQDAKSPDCQATS